MPDLSIQLSHTFARMHGIKAVQPQSVAGVLDVLIAPFWGPHDGRDAHGQYFSPNTNFMHEVITEPPVFYYHGAEMGEQAALIGKSADRWVDDLGVWQTVMLDMTDANARRTWQASLAGNAYASTGVVPASLVVNQATGEIEQWLIGEISLMVLDAQEGVEPANTYAIALPRLKALRESLEPERRKLFDRVYLVASPQGARSMDVIERLQAFFARFIEELAAELDVSAEEAADIIEDAADGGEEIVASDEECEDCEEVAGVVDALLDTLEADTEPVRAKSAAALRRENARLRAKLHQQADADWLGRQVAAKRVTPGEKPAIMAALTKARAGGKATAGTVSAIKAMVEARPASEQRASIKAAGMSRAGFQSAASRDTVDQATLSRMRAYAGME